MSLVFINKKKKMFRFFSSRFFSRTANQSGVDVIHATRQVCLPAENMLFNWRAMIFTFSGTQVRIAEIERLQSLFKMSMLVTDLHVCHLLYN